jgi:hypothetical protein
MLRGQRNTWLQPAEKQRWRCGRFSLGKATTSKAAFRARKRRTGNRVDPTKLPICMRAAAGPTVGKQREHHHPCMYSFMQRMTPSEQNRPESSHRTGVPAGHRLHTIDAPLDPHRNLASLPVVVDSCGVVPITSPMLHARRAVIACGLSPLGLLQALPKRIIRRPFLWTLLGWSICTERLLQAGQLLADKEGIRGVPSASTKHVRLFWLNYTHYYDQAISWWLTGWPDRAGPTRQWDACAPCHCHCQPCTA